METKSEKKSKYNKVSILGFVSLAFFIVFIVILLILLFRGKTTITGEYPANIKDRSMVCKTEGLAYPIFTYDNSTKKETEIKTIFSGEKPSSISLMQALYYNDKNSIAGSEAHNHAAMNKSFGEDGLGNDALGVNYARLEDRMVMNLYVKFSNISNASAKYFLIDKNSDHSLPNTIAELKKNYETKGFSCSMSE